MTFLRTPLRTSLRKVFALSLALLACACAGRSPRVPALMKALKSPKPEVRAQAARKLGEMGEAAAPALPALTEALRDRHSSVYRAAGDALVSLGEGSRAGLMSLAVEPSGWLRCRAVETLGRLDPSPEMVPYLVRALADHDPCVQGKAVDALARTGGPAVLSLVQSLKSPNPALRRGAAEALGRMSAEVRERAVFPLVQDLRGRDEYARGEAQILLEEMGRPAIPSLLPLLEDPEVDLRQRSVVLLGRIGISEAGVVEGLSKALSDKDRLVRLKAAMSLGQLGERDPGVLPVLMARLSSPADPAARRGLISAIGNMGLAAKDAVGTLMFFLSDEDEGLREEASEALMKIGTFEAMEAAERHNRKSLKK